MYSKSLKPFLITTLVFATISLGNVMRMKTLADIRAVDIVSLITCGIGIGAFLVSLVVYLKSKKIK